MNSNYRNDRNTFGQRDVGSDKQSRRTSPATSRQPSYGRDNASMRGNDYYGNQGYTNDYSRGNYSTSTFGSGDRTSYNEDLGRQDSYAAILPETTGKQYIEFPDYSNRPTYGSYAGSRAYTNFIDHNYGYSGTGRTIYESNEPASLDASKLRSRYDQKTWTKGTRTRYKSANQGRYSENDGRRR
ncbi:hypothetical protein [Pontibacter anaerobius]|uniref:Uncharacterized protein n=1 Tax=Pontibacter anaerobius TaxID=2993940 RepID=A0ABT3RG00_9BACT|nr:hypothetical protein [Pontibacter anaerobius]MCX2740287.1 hypothetical protein [Pontibacter anaerobius]